MRFLHPKSIDVTDIRTNDNFSMVTCKITNYKDIMQHIQIGELIATNEPFDMKFDGFTSKWKIIFYPKGQFDYGVASGDCRVYIKLISCDKMEVETLKMNIIIYVLSSSSLSARSSVSHKQDLSVFTINDKNSNWAGPFPIHLNGNTVTDSLMIKCKFKLLSAEYKDTFPCKRTLSEVDSSPSVRDPPKKTRSLSPSTFEVDIDELFSKVSPNPFVSKSPLQYPRLTQHRQNMEEIGSAYDPQGKFKFKKPSRTIIFTPEERAEVQALPSSCGKLSLRKPSTFVSSRCLSVSDIFRNVEPNKEDNPSASVEKNEVASDADKLPVDESNNTVNNVRKRLNYYESFSK